MPLEVLLLANLFVPSTHIKQVLIDSDCKTLVPLLLANNNITINT